MDVARSRFDETRRTICPAPTTPSLLTSAAAILGFVLKERRRLTVAKLASGLVIAEGNDIAFQIKRRDFEYSKIINWHVGSRKVK